MPLYQVIFLEVPTLMIILWVASRIFLLEKRLKNVEEFLGKGGQVSLSLDVDGLKELGRKMAEEEKEKPDTPENEEKENPQD